MNEQVTEYIGKITQEWQVTVCNQLRTLILGAMPDIEERLQYGKPHYVKNKHYVALFATAKGWVSFTLFNAQNLDAPEGFFEASDVTDRRTIKIREGQAVDYAKLTEFLTQTLQTLS